MCGLDTKWKNLNGYNPSPDDLRQMYVYQKYYDAVKVALVYPGPKSSKLSGNYLDCPGKKEMGKECSVISLSVEPEIRKWQENIYKEFEAWMKMRSKETV